MAVVATDHLSLCLEHLRAAIAASATFRAEVEAANEEAALGSIHKFWADDRCDDQARPRAVVGYAGDIASERESFSGLVSTGPLWVLFEFDPEHGLTDHRDQGTDFTNKIGAILSEMHAAAVARPDLYLVIERFEMTGFDQVSAEEATGRLDSGDDQVGEYWWAEFICYWEG